MIRDFLIIYREYRKGGHTIWYSAKIAWGIVFGGAAF